MVIYLADLSHDYLKQTESLFTPTGIGFIASYSKKYLGDKVDIRLFKSVEKLLVAVEERKPDLIGFSNYTWNKELATWAGKKIRLECPDTPIVMGGPNISTDEIEVKEFLEENDFVDKYVVFGGEHAFFQIASLVIDLTNDDGNVIDNLKKTGINGSYSLADNELVGNKDFKEILDLDEVPSPFLSGMMDEFLDQKFNPLLETTRGCPFACTFCVWGDATLNKIQKFSSERVAEEVDYISKYKNSFNQLYLADANFGILKRDVEIAQIIRESYDKFRNFSYVQLYWSKEPKAHMVDIGKTLGELTDTYVAFQSLDPVVLKNIKRGNIKTEKLMNLIDMLSSFSSARTDLLVGLPGETYESHINSLDQAVSYGFVKILGGEIRLLPGSEMNEKPYREEFGLKTKFRMQDGAFGVYRGEFIYEVEEGVRQTHQMSESEMLKLRGLRAFFFGSVTLGEHLPIVKYITSLGASFTEVCRFMVEDGLEDPVFSKTVSWLRQNAEQEWYARPDDIRERYSDKELRDNLLTGNEFVKLNIGLLAKILSDSDQYDSYYRVLEQSIYKACDKADPEVVGDLIKLCKAHNYFRNCLAGDYSTNKEIEVSKKSYTILKQLSYLDEIMPDGKINLHVDEKYEAIVRGFTSGRVMSLMEVCQFLLTYHGRLVMNPEMTLVTQ